MIRQTGAGKVDRGFADLAREASVVIRGNYITLSTFHRHLLFSSMNVTLRNFRLAFGRLWMHFLHGIQVLVTRGFSPSHTYDPISDV